MQLIREQFVFLLVLLGMLMPLASASASEYEEQLPAVTVIKAKDLSSDARLSRDQKKPILLFFSMQGCSWCEYVEEEHLKPMLRNADYRDKVIIRKVMTDDYGSVTDFNGKPISVSELSLRYNASFTPTVIFLDHNGQQLAPRILGVRNTEMYGGDLDEGIKHSCQRLRQQTMALSR
jgi:thioredoxin-related protein